MFNNVQMRNGFTLIELSIVLVVIGLVIGGVLVGQDLVSSAGVRAQISQIAKVQTAVNAFRGKYGYLPGDIPNPVAGQYSFIARGPYPGDGDGDGIILCNPLRIPTATYGNLGACGESAMFWRDLSFANMMDGNFATATYLPPGADVIGSAVDNYLPRAKIGGYMYVWSGGWMNGGGRDGKNYLGISPVGLINTVGGINSSTNPLANAPGAGLRVEQAFAIDSKVDDGMPQAGKIMAMYLNGNVVYWAAGGMFAGVIPNSGAKSATWGPTNVATPWAATDCYNNNNVAGPQTYALQNANTVNCSLSVQF
jgi:prepilin-type N-terminal cleavage/methylation domain-containing protein